MSRELKQRLSALRLLGSRVKPDTAWVKATRETILMQAKNSVPTAPVRPLGQVGSFIRSFFPQNTFKIARGPLMAALSIFAMVLGGSVASVSAAENSLPGDLLYSLKLATEQARLALTSGKEEKLKLKIEFTSRRADELKNVAEQGKKKSEKVVQAAEILKRDLNTVNKQLEEVKNDAEPAKAVEMAKFVDQKTTELVQKLQDSKVILSVETKEKVTEAQAAAADTAVKAIEVLVEKHNESSDVIPETEVVQIMQVHTTNMASAIGNPALAATSSAFIVANSTSSAPLTEAVEQMKVATQSAFAAQKAAEQTEAGLSADPGSLVASNLENASSSVGISVATSSPPLNAASLTSTKPDLNSTSTTPP